MLCHMYITNMWSDLTAGSASAFSRVGAVGSTNLCEAWGGWDRTCWGTSPGSLPMTSKCPGEVAHQGRRRNKARSRG